MQTSYKRSGKRFLSHTFVVRRKKSGRFFPFALPFLCVCAAICFLPSLAKLLVPVLAQSGCFQACAQAISPLLPGEENFALLPDAFALVDAVVPSIRSNEAMAKKYAAQYNGSIRAKRPNKDAPAPSAEPKTETIRDMRIQTLSMAADGLTFNNASDYSLDADALLSAPLAFGSKENEPRVLIVHTHTSEAYFDSPGGRSTDPTKNVVRVGEEIANTLNRAGIVTIHDRTKNDEPDYNGSYKKALGVIQQNLLKYPSIEIVLDVHRDYTVRDEGKPTELFLKPTQTQNGKDAAQIMFVMGTDSMGLYHPDWRHNLSFAVKLQDKMNQLHPNLCRPVNVRIERFNQHMTKGSMIIEVGSSTNTLDEAVRSGSYIGEVIAKVLKG